MSRFLLIAAALILPMHSTFGAFKTDLCQIEAIDGNIVVHFEGLDITAPTVLCNFAEGTIYFKGTDESPVALQNSAKGDKTTASSVKILTKNDEMQIKGINVAPKQSN